MSAGQVVKYGHRESLLARAREIADTIASRAPIAAEAAKLNLKAANTMPAEMAIEYERDLQTICFATEMHKRAVRHSR